MIRAGGRKKEKERGRKEREVASTDCSMDEIEADEGRQYTVSTKIEKKKKKE